VLGLYTRWFNDWALLLGWGAGTAVGTWVAAEANFGSFWTLHVGGFAIPGYTALYTLVINIAVSVALTVVFKAMGARMAADQTVAADYGA